MSFPKKIIKDIIVAGSYPFFQIPFIRTYLSQYCFLGRYEKSRSVFARFFKMVFWANFVKLPYEKRMKLQAEMMGGSFGVEWADHYQADFSIDNFPPPAGKEKFEQMEFREAQPFIDGVESLLKDSTTPFLVIQLGASSGKEIAYFAKSFPTHQFIYTDIFPDVVDRAKRKYSGFSNLDFKVCSGADMASIVVGENENVLILASGSAQYLAPEDLGRMFSRLAAISSKKIHVIVCEPASSEHMNPMRDEGSRFRGNFSYTHNYAWYANANNFETLLWKNVEPYKNVEKSSVHRYTSHLYGHFLNKTPH